MVEVWGSCGGVRLSWDEVLAAFAPVVAEVYESVGALWLLGISVSSSSVVRFREPGDVILEEADVLSLDVKVAGCVCSHMDRSAVAVLLSRATCPTAVGLLGGVGGGTTYPTCRNL